jgi:hypothetical protein
LKKKKTEEKFGCYETNLYLKCFMQSVFHYDIDYQHNLQNMIYLTTSNWNLASLHGSIRESISSISVTNKVIRTLICA